MEQVLAFSKHEAKEALASCACFHFRKTARQITGIFDAALKPTGLKSTQYMILVATYAHEPITLGKLAEVMSQDQTSMSRNVKPLMASGYLEVINTEDKRKKLLKLTEAGQDLVHRARPIWKEAESAILDLYADSWNSVLDILRRPEALLKKAIPS